jgi:hypothetical protein
MGTPYMARHLLELKALRKSVFTFDPPPVEQMARPGIFVPVN